MIAAPILVPIKPSSGLREFQLTKPEVTIGRSRQSDVYLEDSSVSRVHARISLTDGAYVITDSESLHGTHVNGQLVRTQQLADGDVIQIGIYALKFVASPRIAQENTTVAVHVDYLQLLLDVTRMINSALAIDDVLNHVIDAVIQVTRAERGFLMTVSPAGELEFQIGRHFDHTALQTDNVALSGTIVEQVRRTGEAVVLSDTDEPNAPSPRSVIELGLRSVMCVPLKTQDRLIGVIYVDSHRRSKEFSTEDCDLFQSLANHAALAIEKSQLYLRLQQYNASLEEQVRQRTLELIQAEKLATVGRLAAGIAHEINSPLAVLTSNIEMLGHLMRSPARPDAKDLLEELARNSGAATDRLRRIVKAFETFAGLDEAELKQVNVNDAIEEVLALVKSEIPARVRVTKEFSQLEPIWCSPGRIHQALMNLVVNAVQSIDGTGLVELRTDRRADRVRITIRDTGRGMTPEQLAGIFDAHFNKKRDRVGVSFGLIITAQIIQSHDGDIQVESTPGGGTTVRVSFPYRPSRFK